MNSRDERIDFVRFLSALLIMAHHLYHLGLENYPFRECWIYVEMFLLISAYYTTKHFEAVFVKDKYKEALRYTVKKMLPLYMDAFICSFLAWITKGITETISAGQGVVPFFRMLTHDAFAFDLLLLTSTPLVAPLWYLASLIILFPIFLLIVQLKNRSLRLIICSICSFVYYGWVGISTNRTYPFDLLRTLAGLMLGVVLYETVNIVKSCFYKKAMLSLTLVELFCFVFPVVGCFFGWATQGWTSFKYYYLCFFLHLTICFSGLSYTAKIRGRVLRHVISYLGKLSMPMFIIHWYIGTLTCMILPDCRWRVKVLVYYFLTIILSAIVLQINKRLNEFQEKVFKTIKWLHD